MIETILMLYVAFLIVIYLHELGHFPKRIVWKKIGPLPYTASAMNAKFRLGGLIVNAIIFTLVFIYKPETVMLQYIGLIAWLHFIYYTIMGSIVKEPRITNYRTQVIDDVPNKYAIIFITIGILTFWFMKCYYLGLTKMIW